MNTLSAYNQERFSDLKLDLREPRLKKVSKFILQERPGKLLDIGCGDGAFTMRFIRQGFSVYGVDLMQGQVKKALGNGLQACVHDISASPLPYPDETFSLLFAGEVIEHLVDTTAFLRDMYRVLEPQGCLVLTTPNLASFENRIRLLFGFYPEWVEYQLEGGQGHVRAYTPRTIKRHLMDAGFVVEKHVGNWVPFIPQRFVNDIQFPLLSLTGDLFPCLSMDMIIKARKS